MINGSAIFIGFSVGLVATNRETSERGTEMIAAAQATPIGRVVVRLTGNIAGPGPDLVTGFKGQEKTVSVEQATLMIQKKHATLVREKPGVRSA